MNDFLAAHFNTLVHEVIDLIFLKSYLTVAYHLMEWYYISKITKLDQSILRSEEALLTIDRNSKLPIWKQLLEQAIDNITSGKWKAGYRLTPTRELAEQLGVSRSTVQAVYEELFSRGYTVTSRRGGTRISDWFKPMIEEEKSALKPLSPPSIPALEEATERLQLWTGRAGKEEVAIDFTPHEPYLDDLFLKKWRQSFLHASNTNPNLADWSYGNTFGYEPLLYQIQNYLSVERGIHVDIDQILLTSGVRQSIDLIAQALLIEGDTVAVEDPGFPPAWLTMMYRKMNVAPVPVDEQGIVVEEISDEAKTVFITPSHQSATGVILSAKRRAELFEKAIQNNLWIIEDDYDSEFRHKGDPLPTLFSQIPERTLYLMSFSKVIAPGIRISAIVSSVEAIEQLARVHKLTVRHLPIMEQLTLTHFIEHGHFTTHMRRVRNIYRRRREAMIKAIETTGLDQTFSVKGAETGLYLLLEASEDFKEEEMSKKALDHGIRVYPLGPYSLENKRKGWVLGYSKVDEETIEQGIQALAQLVR